MLLFSNINVFTNDLWTKKGENKKQNTIVFLASKRIESYTFIPKSRFETLTLGEIKWPDLINEPGSSYCISVDASLRDTQWNLRHDSKSILRGKGFRDLRWSYDVNMMTSYDLYGIYWLSVALDSSPKCIWMVTNCYIYHGCRKSSGKIHNREHLH